MGLTHADDYVDDAYYPRQTVSQTSSEQSVRIYNTQTLPVEDDRVILQERVEEDEDKVKIIYIEDETTQRSDTVVKAIIIR